MNQRLLDLLGDIHWVMIWRELPIPEFSGFSVEDLIGCGHYVRVMKWFDTVSDTYIQELIGSMV